MVFKPELDSQNATLSNGLQIPMLGLGTSCFGGYDHNSLIFALKQIGYTHIDTATFYECEKGVGDAIKESGLPRNQFFLTTKLWPKDFGYENAKKALELSLNQLGVDYVDLYLVHWPNPPSWFTDKKECLKETWKAMEEIYASGRCKAIGVSNYTEEHLEELFTYCSIKPQLNQIEFHPFYYQKSLLEFCRRHSIVVAGYSPLARMQFMDDDKLRKPIEVIAKSHYKSIAQVLIRWSLQHGVVTIPKSIKEERLSENFRVFDFKLSDDDMNVMNSLCKLATIKTCKGPAL